MCNRRIHRMAVPIKPTNLVARNCVRRSRSFKEQDDGKAAGSLDPLEEPAEIGCRAVQRHGVEQFEAAGEGVLEGISRPRPKLLISGFSPVPPHFPDRKSTRLNSSHLGISYAVFCLKNNTALLSMISKRAPMAPTQLKPLQSAEP